MCSEIGHALDGCTEISVSTFRDVVKSVFTPCQGIISGKFVIVASGLEAEALKEGEGSLLADYGYIESAAFLNERAGVSGVVDCDRDPVGIGCYLTAGIDDGSALMSVCRCSEDKESIGELVGCFPVHGFILP